MIYKKFCPVLILFISLNFIALGSSLNKTNYLAGVIYAEANNEEYYGKSLVATVIWIRADESQNNIHKVITIPRQFAEPKYGDGKQWEECLKLAKEMYNGTFKAQSVILGNGKVIQPDHFFHGTEPWWARDKMWHKVGGLKFLRLDSYRKGSL
jgi:hypothetical protein